MIWWLGVVLLLACAVDGQGNCPTKEECTGYLALSRRRNDADLQPFFATTLGRGLLSVVRRCCQPLIPDEDVCGFPESSGHLNDLQRRGAWPWFAALATENSTKYKPLCGGALISRRHVLTTAHCFREAPPRIVLKYVRLGDYDLDREDEANHVTARILSTKFHPHYVRAIEGNDIALVKLDRDIEFNDFLRPVCLPFKQAQETFDNSILAVVGYGVTADSTSSAVPVAGTVNVVNLTTCRAAYKPIDLKDSILCAGGEQDFCRGDTGGPLNHYDESTGRFYIVGIASFGATTCALLSHPGVYTRVTSFLEWIKNSVNEDL